MPEPGDESPHSLQLLNMWAAQMNDVSVNNMEEAGQHDKKKNRINAL